MAASGQNLSMTFQDLSSIHMRISTEESSLCLLHRRDGFLAQGGAASVFACSTVFTLLYL